ncbi:MAG: alpha/beta hydrolase-fold protein [bacterium]|nr:alpha/beta hydrolase-fold protein [bacterium]
MKILKTTFVFTLLLTFGIASAQTFSAFTTRVESAPESLRTTIVDSFLAAQPRLPFFDNDTTVVWLYNGLVSSVNIPGDANNWTLNAYSMSRLSTTNLWYHTHRFESDARLDYKFVTNGSNWILDPRNPYQVSGGFGPNSEMRMPTYQPPPEIGYSATIPHGTFFDTTFFSTELGNSRTVRVYLPPTYNTSSDSFPVVLAHDGLEYISLARMNNVLDNLIASERIQPCIVVFVPPVNRTNEYAGNQMSSFSAFLVNTVMATVDQRFRTRRDPTYRATLGASNGGNISLWLGLHYPQVFGNVVAQSSNVQTAISNGFRDTPRLPLKLYLDLGTYDIPALIPLVRNFVPILQERGYPYYYIEFHEGHSWGNWRAHLDIALEYLFPGPALSAPPATTIPTRYDVAQVFPNPGNASFTVKFHLPSPQSVSIVIFDTTARLVGSVAVGNLSTGDHIIPFDGASFASGSYYCWVRSRSGDSVTRFVVLK